MITHVVMFKLHDTVDKKDVAQEIKMRLDSLPAKIDVIKTFEVGLNVLESARSYDMVLVSTFESLETLAVYSKHPDHVAHLDFIRNASASIMAVDYGS